MRNCWLQKNEKLTPLLHPIRATMAPNEAKGKKLPHRSRVQGKVSAKEELKGLQDKVDQFVRTTPFSPFSLVFSAHLAAPTDRNRLDSLHRAATLERDARRTRQRVLQQVDRHSSEIPPSRTQGQGRPRSSKDGQWQDTRVLDSRARNLVEEEVGTDGWTGSARYQSYEGTRESPTPRLNCWRVRLTMGTAGGTNL